MLARKALAGTAGAPKVYVEDVFSTYLYTGNSTNRSITNDIDLSSKGGLVWIKDRNYSLNPTLFDTSRGATKYLFSDNTNAEGSASNTLTAFNSNGFNLGTNTTRVNGSGVTYASWTFRKQPKFFDVVTYTGNGSNRTISHSLGSTPGCIIVKRTDTTGDWYVYHRSNTANPETDYLLLNSTAATADLDTVWNDTAPTSTVFSVGTNSGVNANTGTYVAYLFAHDAGGFGDAGSDSIIKCGSYTTDGSGNATVTLDWEPQWLLTKLSSTTGDWRIIDNMREMSLTNNFFLYPNTSGAEVDNTVATWRPTATGFTHNAANANQTFIYIAIRRGPMKTPETGTSVFSPQTATGYQSPNIVTDSVMFGVRAGASYSPALYSRLQGNTPYLVTSSTAAEATGSSIGFDSSNGVNLSISANWITYYFKRAPGFFDVVCYTGTGANRTVSHNLGVAPELMIVKRRETANAWAVYANNDNTDYLVLNTTAATVDDNTYWNDTSPTSSVFSVGTNNATNASGSTYVAYLFASLSGVSKIGTYTGNGSSVTVTTNFQPRFIMVKRTDSTGDWIVGDSARGFVTGNDPYLELNTTDAEVTNEDWVDISSTSFTVNQTTNNANVNTGTYIYLAIA